MCCISHRNWVETDIIHANATNIGPTTYQELELKINDQSPFKNDWDKSKFLLFRLKGSALTSIVAIIAEVAWAILIIVGTVATSPLAIAGLAIIGAVGLACIGLACYQYKKCTSQMEWMAQILGSQLYLVPPPPASNVEDMAAECNMHLPSEVIDLLKLHLQKNELLKWPFVVAMPSFGCASGVYLYLKDSTMVVYITKVRTNETWARSYEFKNGVPCFLVAEEWPLVQKIQVNIEALTKDLQLLSSIDSTHH